MVYLLKSEECLFGETGQRCCESHHERDQAESCVNGNQSSSQGGSPGLTAQQDQEAEETHH